MKYLKSLLVVCICLFTTITYAQTKIQCFVNQATGLVEAPLAWQNTLGTARANAMCQTSTAAALSRRDVQIQQINSINKYAANDGEKTSAALVKWGLSMGYTVIWEAPALTDLTLKPNTIEARSFIELVSVVINSTNSKLLKKRKMQNQESAWALPLEAISYSNKVIRIVVKQ